MAIRVAHRNALIHSYTNARKTNACHLTEGEPNWQFCNAHMCNLADEVHLVVKAQVLNSPRGAQGASGSAYEIVPQEKIAQKRDYL